MKMFEDFEGNEKGSSAMDDVVTVAIALILIATLGVAAWQLLGNANYTGVDATTTTLVQTVVGIIAAIAVVLILLRVAKGR